MPIRAAVLEKWTGTIVTTEAVLTETLHLVAPLAEPAQVLPDRPLTVAGRPRKYIDLQLYGDAAGSAGAEA